MFVNEKREGCIKNVGTPLSFLEFFIRFSFLMLQLREWESQKHNFCLYVLF